MHMSRIGKKAIDLPKGVSIDFTGNTLKVKGPKGDLSMTVHPLMKIVKEEATLKIVPTEETSAVRKFHGLTRSLVNNMIIGVTQNFQKKLILSGVGYRAAVSDQKLNLTIGFSHPVVYLVPKGITMTVEKQTEITVQGANKEQVGQVAADIRAFRRPEPYHGKGIRYADEVIVTKVGKSGGKK